MALWRNALAKVVAVATATAYQIKADQFGTKFTNRGSTASFTFTLPPTADIATGWWCEFYGVSAYGFVVASSTTDTLVVLNDATADTLTMTTTSLIIGAALTVTWDGTGWLTERHGGNTYTVAT